MDRKAVEGVLKEVLEERIRQFELWGDQEHPNGTGSLVYANLANSVRVHCDILTKAGDVTWLNIMMEEVMEAFAEEDPDKLREELIQVAAVAVSWVEKIDRDTKS